MEVYNKRTIFGVKNQNSDLKLDGEVQVNEDKVISSFYGTLYSLEDEFVGNFSYSENGDKSINLSVNNYSPELDNKGATLIDETVEQIKLLE